MASSRHTATAVQLAVQAERIRGLEAQVATLTKALEQALSQPAVVYQGDAGPTGPGFALLAQQTLANADEPAPLPTPPPVQRPEIHWFRADGSDPAAVAAEA